MSTKRLQINGYKGNYLEESRIDVLIKYIESIGLTSGDIVKTCLLVRYLPMAIPKSDPQYTKISIASAISINYWGNLIREYAGLSETPNLEYEIEEVTPNAEDIPLNEKKNLDLLLEYLNSNSTIGLIGCVEEVLSMRYLPMALGEENNRFRLAAIESANACEAAAKIIREYAGYSVVKPTNSQVPLILAGNSLPDSHNSAKHQEDVENSENSNNQDTQELSVGERIRRSAPKLSWGDESSWGSLR